jgi:hypothetical protein
VLAKAGWIMTVSLIQETGQCGQQKLKQQGGSSGKMTQLPLTLGSTGQQMFQSHLDDVNEVDAEGNAVLDADGVQLVTKGLKSNAIALVKQQAAGLLTPTDWYVTRKAETDAEIPSDILTYRQSVRTASGAIEAAISGVTTLEAFIALYEAPVDAEGNVTGNAPINDWPDA